MLLNKIVKSILNIVYKFREKNTNNRIKKILFVRFDNKVGDTIIESFFVRELKKINSEMSIDVIMMYPYSKLIENNPYINKIFSIPFNKNKWIKAFSLLPYLKKQQYDLIIDIPTKPTIKRLIYSCLIKSRNIMSTNSNDLNLVNYNVFWNNSEHLSKVFIKGLELLGAEKIDTKYELFVSQKDKTFAKNFIIGNHLVNKNFLVFNPKGSTSTRSLSKENIKKILVYLKKYDYSIVLLDYEEKYMDFKNLALLYTSNNIMQVAALIEKSDYVLTTDTGIVHIADVYLKPMTVLYSDVFKEGEEPRNDSYITEWKSINPKTKMLRDKYNVNNINLNNIFNVLDKDLNKYE